MGQGQARIAGEAASKLATPSPLSADDFELFKLFWAVPFTRKDTYTEVPAKVFVEIRRSNPQKFSLLIVTVRTKRSN